MAVQRASVSRSQQPPPWSVTILGAVGGAGVGADLAKRLALVGLGLAVVSVGQTGLIGVITAGALAGIAAAIGWRR